MNDAVDLVQQWWREERPELDTWPSGIIGRVQRLATRFNRDIRGFLAEYQLEYYEFDVLTTLRRSGPPYALTAGAIVKASMMTSGAITNRIDRVEKRELVERVRDADDRRVVLVRLTDKGGAIIDTVFEAYLAHCAQLLSGLSSQRRDQLVDGLRELLEQLDDSTLD